MAGRLVQVVAMSGAPTPTLTGFWLVTIGEGRRLALELLARRKAIKKTHPVSCMIEIELDPQEFAVEVVVGVEGAEAAPGPQGIGHEVG